MTNRWKVERWDTDQVTPWWVIEHLGDGGEHYHGAFRTHTEAIFYADKRARKDNQ